MATKPGSSAAAAAAVSKEEKPMKTFEEIIADTIQRRKMAHSIVNNGTISEAMPTVTVAMEMNVELVLHEMTVEYAHQLASMAAQVARHRNGDTLEERDVLLSCRKHPQFHDATHKLNPPKAPKRQ
ncbi:Aste57867_8524 [Aphanomyces stellatus]|uniref:Aste57867_8524 protein n=1 Tax=Aphanomyces stellatus TaxID=120398 RepID=A0A485KKG8_9STRA|nr:hypothetical protein As57867_008492 [Aphanomyces stellatus]VFT85410.1 Aste57867_8524 [Aphanomyces stellatus]